MVLESARPSRKNDLVGMHKRRREKERMTAEIEYGKTVRHATHVQMFDIYGLSVDNVRFFPFLFRFLLSGSLSHSHFVVISHIKFVGK